MKRIHVSRIFDLMEKTDPNGRKSEFSVEFIKRSTGELVRYDRAVLTSIHAKGCTINILECGASEPRKIRRCLITRYNDVKVYL